MRPPRAVFIAVILTVVFIASGCTELNPTFDPNQTGPGLDSAQTQFDGAVQWKDHQVPVDQPQPQADQDPTCPPGQNRCGGKCYNLKTDANNCGKCGQGCGKDDDCVGGICCDKGFANCNGTCVDVADDTGNCGGCGNKCPPGDKCTGGKCQGGGPTGTACADGTDDQKFSKGMVGCKGRKYFSQRADLCAKGFRPCKASEWVANRGNATPKDHYWTNDSLRYNGSSNACYVSTTGGTQCSNNTPMRVCAGKYDSLWNYCNWYNCGYGKASPNHYFGGCMYGSTAGALCCPN